MNHAVPPPVAPWLRILRPLAWGGALVLLATALVTGFNPLRRIFGVTDPAP